MKRYTFFLFNSSNGLSKPLPVLQADDLSCFDLKALKATALSLELMGWFLFDNLLKAAVKKGKF